MNVTEVGIKEGRTHYCGNGCCQRDNAEHEGYDRAPTDRRITENNTTNADRNRYGLL
jgi:RNA-directed DNA polymerase